MRLFAGGTEFAKAPFGTEEGLQNYNMSHVHTHCAAKHGRLVRLVASETTFFIQTSVVHFHRTTRALLARVGRRAPRGARLLGLQLPLGVICVSHRSREQYRNSHKPQWHLKQTGFAAVNEHDTVVKAVCRKGFCTKQSSPEVDAQGLEEDLRIAGLRLAWPRALICGGRPMFRSPQGGSLKTT